MHSECPLIEILREHGNYRAELRSTQSDSLTVEYDFQGTVHYDEGKRGQHGEVSRASYRSASTAKEDRLELPCPVVSKML
jgi:hypothetical protein